MDELSDRPPLGIRRGLIALALVAIFTSGCEQLGLGKTKTNPVVPPPPERKTPGESSAANTKVRKSSPVKLDGSAAGSESAVAPDAPGIAASQTLAGAMAQGTPPNSPSAPALANQTMTADVHEAPDDDHSTDNKATDDESPGDDGPGAKRNSAAPQKIVQVRGSSQEAAQPSESVAETGNDLLQPIETEGAGTRLESGEVSAIVNGVPIFTEDVLRGLPEEVAKQFAAAEQAIAEGKVPPEQAKEVQKARQYWIKNLLKPHVDQELLLQALKAKMKDEQLKGIQKHLDSIFDTEYLPGVMKKQGVTTLGELELILQKSGSSVEAVRTTFRNRELARSWMQQKGTVNEGFDRPDILKYYHDHIDDYAITAKAKWEQIQIKFDRKGGKEAAGKKLDKVLERLKAGEVFAVVAKDLSDSPTAAKGGLWGWTTRGSYKNPEIDKAIFEQPVGEIGPPIETKTSFEIIRVIDRTDAGHKSFDSVYEDIKNHLKTTASNRRIAEVMKELHENASIETLGVDDDADRK